MAGPYVQWAVKAGCMIAVALGRKVALAIIQEQRTICGRDFSGSTGFPPGLDLLMAWGVAVLV